MILPNLLLCLSSHPLPIWSINCASIILMFLCIHAIFLHYIIINIPLVQLMKTRQSRKFGCNKAIRLQFAEPITFCLRKKGCFLNCEPPNYLKSPYCEQIPIGHLKIKNYKDDKGHKLPEGSWELLLGHHLPSKPGNNG